jgi:hypothetical protein
MRAFLIILLVLNGMGILPAAASPAGDCCGGVSCECGCAVPQAASLPASLPRGVWATVLPEFTFLVKSFHSSPHNAPFRPPA